MELISNIFSWASWILGGGTLGLIVVLAGLWFFGKDVSGIVSAVATPLAKFTGNALASFGEVLKAGFADIIDNGKTIVTVFCLMFGVYTYMYYFPAQGATHYGNCQVAVDKAIKSLRKDFRFVKRRR